ncbi:hypothetical protein ACKWTF_015440 [Chironomus riparius]
MSLKFLLLNLFIFGVIFVVNASSPAKADDPPPTDIGYYDDEYYGEDGEDNIDKMIGDLVGGEGEEGEYEYAEEPEEVVEDDY